MKSKTLNNKIRKICDDDSLYNAFGGKCIPYIGWFWRDVDFDFDSCYFGVLPVYKDGFDSNKKVRVGFMQNNKWGYELIKCDGEYWREIKRLLEIAVKAPSKETLRAIDRKIQGLLRDNGESRKE